MADQKGLYREDYDLLLNGRQFCGLNTTEQTWSGSWPMPNAEEPCKMITQRESGWKNLVDDLV